jgi:HPt (histidine-containing phosphotransfer) domain-containing protein
MRALATMIARWQKPTLTPKLESSKDAGVTAPVQPGPQDEPVSPTLDPEVHRSATVVRVWKTHAPEQLERIGRAVETADRQELTQAAHRLKGSCTMFGAVRMADLCLNLERGSGDPNALLADLKEEYERVQLQLAPEAES